ncbi:MAG: wax ester/triacylglycerol synthase domain-containing protein [Acidimicrobiales bacterium]
MRQMLIERHPLMPSMRRKLVVPPFNLGRPYWVKDPDFDIDYHLRRIGVPAPEGEHELATIAGDLASRPLNRARPLREMWVSEGVHNGNVSIVAKMHHSTIDGISGANMMGHLFDLEPRPVAPPDLPEEAGTERIPSEFELLGRGALETITRPFDVARVAPRTMVRLGGMLWSAGRRRGQDLAAPVSAPRTSFNAPVTPHRTVAFTEVKLEAVKTVKDAFDVKVNDVVTAMVSGALRLYLQGRGELPEKSLISAIPVSVHDEAAGHEGMTKISVMFSSLMTDVVDPVERLRAIAETNVQAKELHKMVGADTLMQWAGPTGPAVHGRSPLGRALPARAGDGRRRIERHGALERGPHRSRAHRVPRADSPVVGSGRVDTRGARPPGRSSDRDHDPRWVTPW